MNDMDEPTAWEDINPAMALAAPPEPRSTSLGLTPATPTEFRNELTACLTLVAPSGMSEDDRREWLRVAWGALSHLPADLIGRGCRVARQKCDHPAKIVPTIMAEVKEEWERRRRNRSEDAERSARLRLPPPKRHVMDRRGEPMDEAETAELNRILDKLGATSRYRPDGSRYKVEGAPPKKPDDHRPRYPTRQDYIALGVDPAILDALPPPAC